MCSSDLEPLDGVTDTSISRVLTKANSPYLIHMRFLQDSGTLDYELKVTATAGVIVGSVYVGAYQDENPMLQPDPVGSPKRALGGTQALTEATLTAEGHAVAHFADLKVPGGKPVFLFAYVDNNGDNSAAPLNFSSAGPPAAPDFAMRNTVRLDVGSNNAMGAGPEDKSAPPSALVAVDECEGATVDLVIAP